MFWEFNPSAIFAGCRLVQEDSTTGDPCHHNLLAVSDKAARNHFVKAINYTAFQVCTERGPIALTEEILMNALARYERSGTLQSRDRPSFKRSRQLTFGFRPNPHQIRHNLF
jgi:hypothetical protein